MLFQHLVCAITLVCAHHHDFSKEKIGVTIYFGPIHSLELNNFDGPSNHSLKDMKGDGMCHAR